MHWIGTILTSHRFPDLSHDLHREINIHHHHHHHSLLYCSTITVYAKIGLLCKWTLFINTLWVFSCRLVTILAAELVPDYQKIQHPARYKCVGVTQPPLPHYITHCNNRKLTHPGLVNGLQRDCCDIVKSRLSFQTTYKRTLCRNVVDCCSVQLITVLDISNSLRRRLV